MNTRSLRFRLLAWYISLLMVAFALFGLFMYVALREFLVKNLQDNLDRRAQLIGHSISAAPRLTPAWLQEQIGLLYAPELTSRFVRISEGGTNILYQSRTPHDGSFDPSIIGPLKVTSHDSMRMEMSGDHQRMLVKSMLISLPSASLIVEVGASMAPIHIALNRMLLALVLGAPMVILVAAGGGHILIGRALLPVVRMTRSAEAISLQNLDERLPVTSTGDELETLSLALNRLITRIHDAVSQTRRFVADASHELRTPLAILRGELESVVNRNHLSIETRETLGSNLEEVERLGKIVEGLFALSRLDAGEAQNESIPFDLGKLAATTTEQMALLAEDKVISLICVAAEKVIVRGDPARLKQVIVNLVDNAIKYTSKDGRVDVTVRAEGSAAILEVSDNGIGIPREALPHVFERFFRVDKARSRDLGGAGLGLSIVKSICTAHAGEIQIESADSRGTTVRVRVPLSGDEPRTR